MADEQRPVPLERRHPPTSWVLNRFQLNLDVLREMLDDTAPQLEVVDKNALGPDALARLELLEPQQRNKLEKVLERMQAHAEAEFDRLREAGEELADGVEADPADAKELFDIFGDDQFTLGRFMTRLNDAASGPSRSLIFRNSLLTMAISAFEVLISGIVSRFYVTYPKALGDEKVFSLSDIRSFGDLEDAADQLLASRVDDLMYGGLADWAAWFEKNCQASSPTMPWTSRP